MNLKLLSIAFDDMDQIQMFFCRCIFLRYVLFVFTIFSKNSSATYGKWRILFLHERSTESTLVRYWEGQIEKACIYKALRIVVENKIVIKIAMLNWLCFLINKTISSFIEQKWDFSFCPNLELHSLLEQAALLKIKCFPKTVLEAWVFLH